MVLESLEKNMDEFEGKDFEEKVKLLLRGNMDKKYV
jgi:hypothetical protein